MSTATRLRRFRERQKAGKIVLTIEVDETFHTHLLEAEFQLEEGRDHSRSEIEAATEAWLRIKAAEKSGT